MGCLNIAHDPIYQLDLPERHRFPMEKYDLLPRQLLHEGCCCLEDFFTPTKLAPSVAKKVHSATYVQNLLDLNLDAKAVRKIGFPLSQTLIDREFIIAGGTVEGSLKALESGISFNIAGGTHHAYPEHGEAFCLLNDQAIAAQVLLDQKKAKKILIVDLDVHQGNGTAVMFQGNEKVFTLSFHGEKNYPFRKEKSDLDIGFADGTEDDQYLKQLEKTLPLLIDQQRPDFIFYLAGVDLLSTDKLGRLGMSIAGCKARDFFVFDLCHRLGIPVQCSMGGGYSQDIKRIIEAHANTYRIARDLYS